MGELLTHFKTGSFFSFFWWMHYQFGRARFSEKAELMTMPEGDLLTTDYNLLFKKINHKYRQSLLSNAKDF